MLKELPDMPNMSSFPNSVILLGTIVFLLTACSGNIKSASDTAPVSAGFSLMRADGLANPLLKPDGWFFHQESKGGNNAYFITQEKIVPDKWFKTGMTVNVLQGASAVPQGPSAYARLMLQKYAQEGRVVARKIVQPESWLELFAQDVILDESSENPVHLHLFLAANNKESRLYVCLFESPQAIWTEMWPIGKKIIQHLFSEGQY